MAPPDRVETPTDQRLVLRSILFDRNMRVKITDFGTAKLLKQNEMKDGHPLDGAFLRLPWSGWTGD